MQPRDTPDGTVEPHRSLPNPTPGQLQADRQTEANHTSLTNPTPAAWPPEPTLAINAPAAVQ